MNSTKCYEEELWDATSILFVPTSTRFTDFSLGNFYDNHKNCLENIFPMAREH